MRIAAALLSLLPSVACQAQIPAESLTLGATHESEPVALLMDGDAETCWAGDGHSLRTLPTSVVITFDEPTVVGRVDVLTIVAKDRLRLTDLEAWGRVGEGWVKLGATSGNTQERFSVELTPVSVDSLRLRILDTEREDHAWPRICELLIFESDETPASVEPGEIPDEGAAERLFVEQALGIREPIEPTVYDPAIGYLGYVRRFADTLIEHGADTYGEAHSPMWVSILGIDTKTHPNVAMPPIAGQRQGDRALFGGNLQHDVMMIRACEALTRVTGEQKYRNGAGRYLKYFLTNCTDTATGLWPWGEHAHWDYYKEAPGNTTHEFLGAPPLSFWEQAWQLNPEAVLGEADGLINHVVDLETFDYNRHADISRPLPDERPENTTFLDFPRHGGFYIQVWAFAYSKTGDEKYLNWIGGIIDHHVAVRHPETHLLPSTTTRDNAACSAATQLSLAVTMLESVPLLDGTKMAGVCWLVADQHLAALTALPHKPAEGLYMGGCPIDGPAPDTPLSAPKFTAHYGGEFLAMDALLWLRAYELTEDPAHWRVAVGLARFYAEAGRVPESAVARAHVYGSLIDLMVAMYEHEGGEQWMPAAESYAQQAIEALYADGLFRGATGLWYYESETWPSTLAYSLLRLHAVKSGIEMERSYFHR